MYIPISSRSINDVDIEAFVLDDHGDSFPILFLNKLSTETSSNKSKTKGCDLSFQVPHCVLQTCMCLPATISHHLHPQLFDSNDSLSQIPRVPKTAEHAVGKEPLNALGVREQGRIRRMGTSLRDGSAMTAKDLA